MYHMGTDDVTHQIIFTTIRYTQCSTGTSCHPVSVHPSVTLMYCIKTDKGMYHQTFSQPEAEPHHSTFLNPSGLRNSTWGIKRLTDKLSHMAIRHRLKIQNRANMVQGWDGWRLMAFTAQIVYIVPVLPLSKQVLTISLGGLTWYSKTD